MTQSLQPAKDKTTKQKLKKGDIVTWSSKISNIHKKYVGIVLYIVRPKQPIESILDKVNKNITITSVIEMDIQFQEKKKKTNKKQQNIKTLKKDTSTIHSEESYIIAIKNKEGKDVLYWSRNRKISLAKGA